MYYTSITIYGNLSAIPTISTCMQNIAPCLTLISNPNLTLTLTLKPNP